MLRGVYVEDGEITDEELRDVVLNFLIAGRDTTANVSHPHHILSLSGCYEDLSTGMYCLLHSLHL
jgi:hypothetical protein